MPRVLALEVRALEKRESQPAISEEAMKDRAPDLCLLWTKRCLDCGTRRWIVVGWSRADKEGRPPHAPWLCNTCWERRYLDRGMAPVTAAMRRRERERS